MVPVVIDPRRTQMAKRGARCVDPAVMNFIWRVLDATVIDGDTVDLTIDRGFYDQSRYRFRVKGVDTPEVFGVSRASEEYAAGLRASAFTKAWFTTHLGHELRVASFKSGSATPDGAFGRWLGEVWCVCGSHLDRELIAAGHSAPA